MDVAQGGDASSEVGEKVESLEDESQSLPVAAETPPVGEGAAPESTVSPAEAADTLSPSEAEVSPEIAKGVAEAVAEVIAEAEAEAEAVGKTFSIDDEIMNLCKEGDLEGANGASLGYRGRPSRPTKNYYDDCDDDCYDDCYDDCGCDDDRNRYGAPT
jgi:cell division septum initiation protein DivIVA